MSTPTGPRALSATAAQLPAAPLPGGLAPATLGWLLGALGVAVFALTIPMTRLASGTLAAPQLPAVFVAIGRAALGGLLAAAWLLVTHAPWPRPAQWRQLLLTSLGVVFGFPFFLAWRCSGWTPRMRRWSRACCPSPPPPSLPW